MLSQENKKYLDFGNTEIAFRHKSDQDLERARWLFKLMANSRLIQIGTPLVNLALKLDLPIQGLIKKTIYKHFCGGETIQECAAAIESLGRQHVTTILDYSVEGEDSEASFDACCHEILSTVSYARINPLLSFCVFKPTALGRLELLAKRNAGELLTSEEEAEFQRVTGRFDRICKAGYDANVKVLIDAEHSWIQNTIDDIARQMMEKYNKEKPIIYNTYQLYLHDKLASLKADFAYAKVQGFYLGAKIVRGAYMEIERERATEKGYPSPIHPNKAATDKYYNMALLFCLDNIRYIGFMAGTHNDDSCMLLAQEMNRRNMTRTHPRVFFAQLFGMSDNLSFNLSAAGYNVAKYMPYGPVKAVMPYLSRRAQENTSVAGQTGRELSLILQEKKRRKSFP